MAISSLTARVNQPPVGAIYLGDALAAASRNLSASKHLTPLTGMMAGENTFTGFTSTAGFTDVVVTSPDELRAQMQAQTINQRRRYLLRWNGRLDFNFDGINCVSAAQYDENVASDWGYDRPDHAVWIAPDEGFAPIIGALPNANLQLSNQITIRGCNWLFLEGFEFRCRVFVTRTAFFPGLTIYAHRNMIFQDLDIAAVGQNRALLGFPVRAMHTENTQFINCFGGVGASSAFMRGWNDSFRQAGVQDIYNCSGFDPGMSSYGMDLSVQNPNVWLFGTTVWQTNIATVASGLHTDFFQCHNPNDAQDETDVLIEHVRAMLNSSTVLDQPQAQFIQADGIGREDGNGVPGAGNLSMRTRWTMHNCLVAHAAANSLTLQECSDSTDKNVMNNTLTRSATFSQNTMPQITPIREQVGTEGIWRVRGNVLGQLNASPFNANDIGNNAAVDPRITGAGGADAFFTGNGTWGTDANGFRTYTSPDAAAADVAAAKAAIDAFFEPLSGWNDSGGSKQGVTNPALWPTQPLATIA